MKHIILSVITTLMLYPAQLFAAENNDGVFLSLTRKPEAIEMMPVNVTSISAEQMEKYKPRELTDVLTDKAGIYCSRIGSAGSETSVMIRGASSAQVLVLINGKRANTPSSGVASLSLIPLSEIERVEIIRGGASAIYGTGAAGGVINIITKKPEGNAPSLELALNAGSFATAGFDLSLHSGKGPLSVFATAGRAVSDGWRQNSDLNANTFYGNFVYDAGKAGQFGLTSSFVSRKLGLPGPGVTLEEYNGKLEKLASTPHARQNDTNYDCKLENTRALGGSTLKTSLYANDKLNSFLDPSIPQEQKNSTFVYGSEAQFSAKNGLTAGIEWWEELYKQKDAVAGVTGIDKSRITTALYAQQNLKAGKFNFIPSLRYDQNSAFGGIVSPHMSVVFTANDTLKFSLNSGKIWRAPSLDDLYYPADIYGMVGNPKLKPEEGIASDAGTEVKLGASVIKMNVFAIRTSDLISWQPVAGSFAWTPQNIGNSLQTGTEFEFGQKIASGLYHKLNYTYLWAEDIDSNKVLIYRPRNTLNYDISAMTLWNISTVLQGQYVSETITGQGSPETLPSYSLINLEITRKIKDLDLWCRVDNITDKKYQTRAAYNGFNPGGYPLPGITYSAGVKVRFWD